MSRDENRRNRLHGGRGSERRADTIASLGVGKRVVVRLRDSAKVTGRISAIDPETFTIRPDGDAPSRTIAYTDVRKVSTKMLWQAKTLMVVGIGVGAYALGFWIAAQHCCS